MLGLWLYASNLECLVSKCHLPSISSMETYFFDRGLYKIFTKVLANRLQKYLPKLIHPAQYGFIAGRNILHNVLNVQMVMDYARRTHQELIMVQLDLEKAYDRVYWSFVCMLMHTMGFGPHMSSLIFLLGQDAVSQVMLNGGIT